MTLIDIYKVLKKNLFKILFFSIFISFGIFLYTVFFVPKAYSSTVSLYCLLKEDPGSLSITASDMNASQMLANDISALANTDRVQKDVLQKLGLSSLAGFDIKVEQSATSRVLTLTVVSTDSTLVSSVANSLADVISEVAYEVMDIDSISILNYASETASFYGPNAFLDSAYSFIFVFFLSSLFFILCNVFDTRVTDYSNLPCNIDFSLLARIPRFKNNF